MKHKHGGDIYRNPDMIDFSANINPLGMPEQVRSAAIRGVECSVFYPDVECWELKQALSREYEIPEEFIICGNGAAELIFSLVSALRPKKALLTAPTFAEYEQALESARCEVSYYFLKEENNFILEHTFLEECAKGYDVIFLCNPNNPTGQIADRTFLISLLKICEIHHTILILDECFMDFLMEEENYSMVCYCKKSSHLFILKAFTKMFAMPGLRLGYGLCSNQEILEKMSLAMQPWNVSIPAQMAGIAALKEKEFVRRTQKYIETEKKKLISGMEKNVKKIYGHQANYIFFQDTIFLQEQMKKEKIMIRDCSNYKGLSQGFYRIAVRTERENDIFLQVLKKKEEKLLFWA